MTLQNRIKRLEADARGRLTGYCNCDLPKEFRILRTPEEVAAADNEPPIQCGQCGRDFEKTRFTFDLGRAELRGQ